MNAGTGSGALPHAAPAAAPLQRFPNYLQLPTFLPLKIWMALRAVCVGLAFAMAALLIIAPPIGLTLFWAVTVPILPAVFVLAPGVWRNVCPMAALNQTPRLLGFTRGLSHTPVIREYSYVLGIALFFALVSSRKWLFDSSGVATALLILFGLGGAFVGGIVFKGKSGWCSSICPMLPVQRVYGQTPVKPVANAHCRPCVGCTKNCFDFNPGVAYLADQYDADKHYVGYRRLFVAVLPGFILAFFSIPKGVDISAIYGTFGWACAASLALFQILDTFLKLPNNRLTVIFGAAAFSAYYWFASETWLGGLSALTGHWPVHGAAVWVLRAGVVAMAAQWIVRSFKTEDQFIAQTVQRTATQPVKLGEHAAAALKAVGESARAAVVIQPENKTVPAQTGQSLLEVIEGCGARIEAGCRMGVCGADPIAVHGGAECLSPQSDDERNTLARLGHASNTRLACSARLQKGTVTIALVPDKAAPLALDASRTHNTEIERVVIIGNGIAGVTAADHVRRRHPDCTVHLVADENHALYNRMGITRLVYGRSAMQGLYLMPEVWYSDRKIDVFLNTAARAIYPDRKQVSLADGEILSYDRLILATGSNSFVPPLHGWGGEGCFVLRSANDAMGLRNYVQRSGAQHGVVAGGGLLGLEAAYAMYKLGLRVTVVERNASLLHRQLDERGGRLLQGYLQSLGIHIRLGGQVHQLSRDADGQQWLHIAADEKLMADIFVVAAGIVPNIELARSAGLEVSAGVRVNARMETSVPDIFAAGDVAEFEGRVMGLWPVAVEQAEVAACNALGDNKEYREPVLSTTLKVVGADLTSVGSFDGDAGDEILFEENLEEYRYRKLIVRNGRLIGAILIGWPTLVETVSKAVKSHQDVSADMEALRGGNWERFSGEHRL